LWSNDVDYPIYLRSYVEDTRQWTKDVSISKLFP